MLENENKEFENTDREIDNKENNSHQTGETPKKIEVVNGDGDLTISPVYEHLEVEKPKPKVNKKIFIPEVKGNSSTSTKNDDENDNNDNKK